MKILYYSLLIALTVFSSRSEFGQKKPNKELAALYEKIDIQNFKFEADNMNTATLGFNAITSAPNTVEVKNDSIFVDLPFWGKAFRASFNNEGGFHYQGPIKSKEKKMTKHKHLIIYSLKYQTSEDNLKLIFYLSETEFANLKIISRHRESIDYNGEIYYHKNGNK